jgi:3-dehydrosphinganine reductase
MEAQVVIRFLLRGAADVLAEIVPLVDIEAFMMNYQGKLALVTGGSSGIGLAIAKNLASLGANVWILARRPEFLQSAINEIKSVCKYPDQKVGSIQADIANEEQVTAAITDFINQTGHPDYLFNVAGMTHPGYIVDIGNDVFTNLIHTNYLGMVYCTKAVLSGMIQRRSGYIINISSAFGYLALQGYSAYIATKFAIRGFSDSLRLELRGTGVKITIVFPDDTDTPQLQEEIKTRPEVVKIIAGDGKKAMPASKVAEIILNGVARGKYIITPGFRNSLFFFGVHTVGKLVYPILDLLSLQAETILRKKNRKKPQ